MTITLFLTKPTLFRDIKTIQTIFNANKEGRWVESLRAILSPLNISTEGSGYYSTQIQVTPEELQIIGEFQPEILK